MPFDVIRGFQLGQSAVGPSSFGTFIDQLSQRANQVMGLRLGIGAQVAQQKALLPGKLQEVEALIQLDPTKRFLDQLVGQAQGGQFGQGQPQLGPQGQGLQGRLSAMQSQLGPGQELNVGPLKLQSNRLSSQEITKVITGLEPVANQRFGYLPDPGKSQANAASLVSLIPDVNQEHVPLLQAAVQNGLVLPQHLPALSSAWQQIHPNLPNPFQIPGQAGQGGVRVTISGPSRRVQ